jgi:hypothetical protein
MVGLKMFHFSPLSKEALLFFGFTIVVYIVAYIGFTLEGRW